MANGSESIQRLRKRVEQALVGGKRGADVIEDLEALLESAPESSPDALFAHRQLAEIQLEHSPWRAALHLRRLMQADADDDGVQALMGLCQALLGNFRAAVGAYRRATGRAPANPWYHHNLGHLLDVGSGEPEEAERHLRIAHELEPEEDEITASLAHCLARLGQLEEATELAREALATEPRSEEHRGLLEWIERGAPDRAPSGYGKGAVRGGRATRQGTLVDDRSQLNERERLHAVSRGEQAGDAAISEHGQAPQLEAFIVQHGAEDLRRTRDGGVERVARMLEHRMLEGGCSREHLRRALLLWTDFCGGRELRVPKPATYAAAIEYAIAKVDRVRGVTQASLAARYGVNKGSISSRYGEIRQTLELMPNDPRY